MARFECVVGGGTDVCTLSSLPCWRRCLCRRASKLWCANLLRPSELLEPETWSAWAVNGPSFVRQQYLVMRRLQLSFPLYKIKVPTVIIKVQCITDLYIVDFPVIAVGESNIEHPGILCCLAVKPPFTQSSERKLR
jgi:hypothetical protein